MVSEPPAHGHHEILVCWSTWITVCTSSNTLAILQQFILAISDGKKCKFLEIAGKSIETPWAWASGIMRAYRP